MVKSVGCVHGAEQSSPARRVRCFLLASTAIFAAAPAEAADWLGTVSADWFTAGNWNPAAVPGSGTAVTINSGSLNPAAVNSAGALARTVDIGTLAGQSGTLNIAGGTLTLATGVNPSIMVGNAGAGTLNISAGGVLNSAASYIATNPGGATGTATVTGTGSAWNATSLFVGADAAAVGALNVQNGGAVNVSGLTLGAFNATASGTVTVTGNGSKLKSTGSTSVGDFGTGTMTVTGTGASFETNGFTIGNRGTGIFNLNSGATASSGSTSIGSSNATGNGTVNIAGTGTT